MPSLKNFVCIALPLFVIASCKQKFTRYDAGLHYRIVHIGDGEKVKQGQTLKLQMIQSYKDSTLLNTGDSMPYYQPHDSTQLSKAAFVIFSQVTKETRSSSAHSPTRCSKINFHRSQRRASGSKHAYGCRRSSTSTMTGGAITNASGNEEAAARDDDRAGINKEHLKVFMEIDDEHPRSIVPDLDKCFTDFSDIVFFARLVVQLLISA
jgi:hypothetical protein